MATVKITIRDMDNGEVDVRIESDPPLPGPAAPKSREHTNAQAMACVCMAAMVESASESRVERVSGTEPKRARQHKEPPR